MKNLITRLFFLSRVAGSRFFKKLLFGAGPGFFVLTTLIVQAQDFPKPEGYVNDFAQVLSQNGKEQIDNLVRELKQKTGAEVALVTISTTGDYDPQTYANELFSRWKIGQAGKDNGVLILNATDDRKVQIEVGYGLEGILPDGRVGRLIDDYIVPSLRNGDYDEGLYQGTLAVASIIAKDAGVDLTGQIDVPEPDGKERFSWVGVIVFIIVLLIFRKNPWLLFWLIASQGGKRRGGGWGHGGFGGGWGSGGGGGFGGFGGGFSGGGGAGRGY